MKQENNKTEAKQLTIDLGLKPHLEPIIQWVGGKRRLQLEINQYLPDNINDYTYVEPFIGGGAIWLNQAPKRAIVADVNAELVNLYQVVQTDLDRILDMLFEFPQDKESYWKIRSWDREENWKERSKVERAARFIYLMCLCFNGIYRENLKGQMNSAFGTNAMMARESERIENMKRVAEYIATNDIQIYNKSYHELDIPDDAVVYLDPPYYSKGGDDSFTQYTKDRFGVDDQHQLKGFCDELTKRGILWVQSNGDVPEIHELYREYQIDRVGIQRLVSGKASTRRNITEVIVTNKPQLFG